MGEEGGFAFGELCASVEAAAKEPMAKDKNSNHIIVIIDFLGIMAFWAEQQEK